MAAKANAARDMQEDINSRQLALDDLAAKNDSLSGSNAKLRDKKKQCVDELNRLSGVVEELAGTSSTVSPPCPIPPGPLRTADLGF